MEEAVRHIVIIGGGTAGWLTAGILAADHCAADADGLRVTLIESPDVPTIGVGEGSWPSLRDSLRRIGISERDFLRRCQPTFKQGSRFDGWRDQSGTDSYLHPFDAPPSADEMDWAALWASSDDTPFAFAVSAQASVCALGLGPKQLATPDYAAVMNYGYHLDAAAFAALLTEHCTEKLGVRLIRDTVTHVEKSDNGDVAGLGLRMGSHITGDLYVDCTGMRATIISAVDTTTFTDVSDVLFNNRALVVQQPYADPHAPIPCQTIATATDIGWIWDIPLQTRRGMGLVYSAQFAEESDARRVLSVYLSRYGASGADAAEHARTITFCSAYRERAWVRNVVAIGLAQGFVEPLEASAIVMIELSATMLSDTLPGRKAQIDRAATRFNERFAYRWSRIVDFLKLHYVFSARTSPYWMAHRDTATWTPRLRSLAEGWQWETPSREDFPDAREIFPASSYAYVYYGMGQRTQAGAHVRRTRNTARTDHFQRQLSRRVDQLVQGLPPHRDLIDQLLADPSTHGR